MNKHRFTYSLYKDDKEIAFGTTKEIAKQLGVSVRTIKFYQTPAYIKRCKGSKNRRVLIKVD